MIRLTFHQARYDALAFARNKQARFSTMLMPLLLLVLMVSAFGAHHVGPRAADASTYYVPGIATLAVLAMCFANLVISLTAQREGGVLKRRRTTPVPAPALIAGRTAVAIGATLATVVAVLTAGAAAFGVEPRAEALPGVLLAAVVGSAAVCCMAYAVHTAIRSADAAQPLVQAIMLPLYFSSGIFIPSVSLPGWLQDVAGVLPVAHLSHAFHSAYDPTLHGDLVPWGDLAVLAGWGAAALVIAVRRFRWTPSN